jgi:hypothetical protein
MAEPGSLRIFGNMPGWGLSWMTVSILFSMLLLYEKKSSRDEAIYAANH